MEMSGTKRYKKDKRRRERRNMRRMESEWRTEDGI